MTFGKPPDQSVANCMIERCLHAGINFFDTANAYQHGESERMRAMQYAENGTI
jgi:aryl-alcohol dehydrogenase-like predicted oxidoreductase